MIRVAIIVLSGSSATKMSPKTVATVAGLHPCMLGSGQRPAAERLGLAGEPAPRSRPILVPRASPGSPQDPDPDVAEPELPAGGIPVARTRPDRPLAGDRPVYYDYMIRKMTATEAKARILGLLEEVAAGDEVEITKHGRTVARLAGPRHPHAAGPVREVALSSASDEELFSTGAAWDLP